MLWRVSGKKIAVVKVIRKKIKFVYNTIITCWAWVGWAVVLYGIIYCRNLSMRFH